MEKLAFKTVLLTFAIPLLAPGGEFQAVTNWMPAGPEFRIVTNRVLNISQPPFISVTLPTSRTYHFVGKTPAAGERCWISADWQGNPGISIRNFPWNPADFVEKAGGRVPRFAKAHRAVLVQAHTNWNAQGKPQYVTLNYDYGLPATNLVPVVTLVPKKSTAKK